MVAAALRPSRPPAPDFSQIPSQLKALRRWLCWRYGEEPRQNGKFPKVPYNRCGSKCDYTNPSEWNSYELAVRLYHEGAFDGIGFVLGDGICGLDEDDCLQNGGIEAVAARHIEHLNSYAEESVSGTGVHALAFGTLPGERHKNGKHELYAEKRFFVVTGRRLPHSPRSVEFRDSQLGEVYRMIFGTDSASQFPPITQVGGIRGNTTSLKTQSVPKFSDSKVIAAIHHNPVAHRYWLGYPPGINLSRADFALMRQR